MCVPRLITWPLSIYDFPGTGVSFASPPSDRCILLNHDNFDVLEHGYQALSYVWGTDEKPARALVRDGPGGNTLGYIPLTANVHRTLQDLREAPGIPKKTFWIDQICIDQVGEEKNGQVAMMGSIYKNADRVIFYGGAARDDEFEMKGIELVGRLDAHFSPNYQAMYEIKNLFVAYQKRHTLPAQHMPDHVAQDMSKHATAFQWLAEVGYGEWRQRLWMVQEQLLARELGFLRGPRLLCWTSVAAATFCFYLRFLPPSYVFDFWERPANDYTLPPAKRWRSPWDIASAVFSEGRSVLAVKGRQVDKATLAMPRIYFAKSVHLGVFDDSAVASFSGLLGTWTEILALLGATLENACSLVGTRGELGLLEPSSYADDILPDENRWMVTEFPGRMYIHGRSFAGT